jgi:SAM-dependent methyltransferase
MSPLQPGDFEGRSVLEMGCGNGSQMVHVASWRPRLLQGIDLGNSVKAAVKNLEETGFDRWRVDQADLTTYQSEEGFDVVYCIGVLHHLRSPGEGFRAVIRNVRPGGRFHCWVYAKEGNLMVRLLVEPLRRVLSRVPWWFTKYMVAAPLALPMFAYARILKTLRRWVPVVTKLPLSAYFIWIGQREVGFFRHVIFDQLVAPTTHYVTRAQIEEWLSSVDKLDSSSAYVIHRNGNSWKFGGVVV